MKLLSLVAFALLVTSSMTQNGKYMSSFRKSMLLFTQYLYRDIMLNANEQNSNILFSPFSISQVTGMVLAGAKGTTKQQLRNVLYLRDLDDYRISKLMQKTFRNAVLRIPEQTLIQANAMYLQENFEVKPTYMNELQNYYKTEVNKVSFDNPTEAAERINTWIANKTHNLIRNLVTEDQITSLTRLMLINAVYFQSAWDKKFAVLNQNCTFYLDTDEKQVPCMQTTGWFKYHRHNTGMEFIAIPYLTKKNKKTYMIIGKPQNNSFRSVTDEMRKTFSTFHTWATRKVENLTMPMFDFTQAVDVKKVYKRLQVHDLFDAYACDLTGISETPLYVSHFNHKAHITVNEHGTRAAAASAIALVARSFGRRAINFNVDRPFFFGIYSENAQIFIFVGKVGDPTKDH